MDIGYSGAIPKYNGINPIVSFNTQLVARIQPTYINVQAGGVKVVIGSTKLIYPSISNGTLFDGQASLSYTFTHKIHGHVYDKDFAAASRQVLVYSKLNNSLIGSTISNAVTGEYEIQLRSADKCYVISLPLDGEHLNALIYDDITPVPI